MRPLSFALLAVPAVTAVACHGPGVAPAPPRPAAGAADPVADLVRVRCATDGRDVVTSWRGQVYADVPGEAPRHLFAIVGMNVARCAEDADGWYLTSRELMLYLDPDTGAVLRRWHNPWTGVDVPVVHVANSPVQARLGAAPPLERHGPLATFVYDIPLGYPNPIHADEALRPFAPSPTYEAIEMFGLTAPADEVGDPARPTVSWMTLTWHRVGPWLPWMGQGDAPGRLVYRATGERVDGIAALPAELRDELATRLPRYRAAPTCLLDAANVTSWTYFVAHADAYRRGDRFPLPAPVVDEPCRAAAAPMSR
ncbi:MAG: DUF1838 family protein [Kofleriaceae bacterium]|nr:DUF1838 family protein [Kofleriaceae bacterium]